MEIGTYSYSMHILTIFLESKSTDFWLSCYLYQMNKQNCENAFQKDVFCYLKHFWLIFALG